MGEPIRHDSRVPRELHAAHLPDAVKLRLQSQTGRQHPYVRDFIFGAIDGAVTTFAVVAGVAGAGLSTGVIVIMGVANLVADGFSMAASNFLGTRAEREQLDRIQAMEERHIATVPEGEREEIRQIFQQKGFEGELLEQVVEVVTGDKQRWVNTMLMEEHGLSLSPISPWKAGAATMAAFVLAGLLPILPFLIVQLIGIPLPHPFLYSSLLTAVAFFLVGATKSVFVDRHWLTCGLETLLVGGIAAALAYAGGLLLQGLA